MIRMWTAKLYQRNGDVKLVCKAYNGRVILQWLAETVTQVAQQNDAQMDDRTPLVAVCMSLI